MNKITESDARIKLGTVNFHGKEYFKLPVLICKKHWSLCEMLVNRNDEGTKWVEVKCTKCDEEEKQVEGLL